jgi:hypothetical protein
MAIGPQVVTPRSLMLLSRTLYGAATAACAIACPTKKRTSRLQQAPPRTTERDRTAGKADGRGRGRSRVVVADM